MKYNHAFTSAFTVITENDDQSVTASELREGLARRLRDLLHDDAQLVEACGLPFDTYEEEP